MEFQLMSTTSSTVLGPRLPAGPIWCDSFLNHESRICNLFMGKITNYRENESSIFDCFLYSDFRDIDLFIGGLSEVKAFGSILGPTFGCLNGIQFHHWKFGDRFYFEHGGEAGSFNIGKCALCSLKFAIVPLTQEDRLSLEACTCMDMASRRQGMSYMQMKHLPFN